MTTKEAKMSDELLPSFEKKFQKTDGCWVWEGAVQSRGYGNFRSKLAHRVSFTLYRGEIPDGMTLDHICRNRLCINPDHLEPVSQYENNMRGLGFAAKNKRKIVCSQGHILTPENISIYPRKDGIRRRCKQCAKEKPWKK